MQRISHKARSVLEKKIFKGIFPYKCTGKQTWPCRKKVKHQRTTILLAILVDLPSPTIIPRHSRFWRRRFLKVFTMYGHGGHLGQRTATICAIFCSPTLRRLHMKFEQNWLNGFRGEVIWKVNRRTHRQTDARWTKSGHNNRAQVS